MRRYELEQIRPWLDAERPTVDAGYKPPKGVISKGYLRLVVDRFYELTEKGQREAEELIGRPL